MPVENRSRLTDTYGWKDWRQYTHAGIDFGGVTSGESSKVLAAVDGVVDFAGWNLIPNRNGQHVGIRHPDGSLTFYGHVRWPRVKVGQHIQRGQWIAESWHTGLSLTAGIHLHFEWWKDCNNHRTHFDPTDRLADYGWTLRWDNSAGRYRLHDEWEGRTHATPVTIIPAAPLTPTPEPAPEGLTVSQYEELKAGQVELGKKLDRLQTSLGGANITIQASNGKTYKTNMNGALKVIETLTRQSSVLDKDNAADIDNILEIVGEEVPETEEEKAA